MLTQTLNPMDTATALIELGLDEPEPMVEKSEMPFQTVIIPDFDQIGDEQLEPMLPQPLLDCYRLSKRFIQFVEHARALPPTHLEFVKEILKEEGRNVGDYRGSHFSFLLLQCMERLDEDCFLADQFQELMELSDRLPAEHRQALLELLSELNALTWHTMYRT